MRPLLLSAVLLVACGDDTIIVNNPGAGGAAAVGSGGSGDGGGATAGNGGDGSSTATAATSTGSASSSSAGGVGSTSEVSSGSGGTGGDGGAGGGGGGNEPTCPDVECSTQDLSCDPTCDSSDYNANCKNIECEQFGSVFVNLGAGGTVLAPALDGPIDPCNENCDGSVWWSVRAYVPRDSCIVAYGPPGTSVAQNGGACSVASTSCVAYKTPSEGNHVVTLAIPAGLVGDRKLFTVEVLELEACDSPNVEDRCLDAGCNGAGD